MVSHLMRQICVQGPPISKPMSASIPPSVRPERADVFLRDIDLPRLVLQNKHRTTVGSVANRIPNPPPRTELCTHHHHHPSLPSGLTFPSD